MMNQMISRLLAGQEDNHLMPFFWQHGEEEATLRKYMEVIDSANCHAVCVESRPHPDFCGDGWWRDMDIILDEARKRDMKVWILDDSHFPTGFANGAVKDAPLELHRQGVCANRISLEGAAETVTLRLEGLIPPPFTPIDMMEQYVLPSMLEDAPHFEDDRVIALTAVHDVTGETVEIPYQGEKEIAWEKPEGAWTVWVVGLSRNTGIHREYMNMLDPASCRLLIDAVYEKHWQHYGADFGKNIVGFFSDEPELGNGHLFYFDNLLGTDQDLPFARTMPEALRQRLGENWSNQLYLLWSQRGDPKETARVRYAYMDAVTRLVRESFSRQIGDWCRAHGVQYIGHVIEDGNAHARTGASLGHYFRGLDGQDMSGIDDIGGQVLPQGEDEPKMGNMMRHRDGTFYHFMLGNLAASGAAIQPGKHGNAMCEIFGNYGWAEGVRLEKYLADHFMVRGINYFVPHAFSPAPFPDPDCPPHFYAQGHNPQYRHFGKLMQYMNRVSSLISGGRMMVNTAILYHGEAEWAGEAMLSQVPARVLAEHQIGFHTIPCDVFSEQEHYGTRVEDALWINGNAYHTLIVPWSRFLPQTTVSSISELMEQGVRVIFLDAVPEGCSDSDLLIPENIWKAAGVNVEGLPNMLEPDAEILPASRYIRVLHYQGEVELYYFVNEAEETWTGTVQLSAKEGCLYDAWGNRLYPAQFREGSLFLTIEPLKSIIFVVDQAPADALSAPVTLTGAREELKNWKRSLCAGIDYPNFGEPQKVALPDHLAEELPEFSGYARYETSFRAHFGQRVCLEVTDAYEGVEVFVNGKSKGIQIAPTFRYDLSDGLREGENTLVIEVATTLERQMYGILKDDVRSQMRGLKLPVGGSGITGRVWLYREHSDDNAEMN